MDDTNSGWTCSLCDFQNAVGDTCCTMCDTKRVLPSAQKTDIHEYEKPNRAHRAYDGQPSIDQHNNGHVHSSPFRADACNQQYRNPSGANNEMAAQRHAHHNNEYHHQQYEQPAHQNMNKQRQKQKQNHDSAFTQHMNPKYSGQLDRNPAHRERQNKQNPSVQPLYGSPAHLRHPSFNESEAHSTEHQTEPEAQQPVQLEHDQWQCSVCTFVNNMALPICETCLAKRPENIITPKRKRYPPKSSNDHRQNNRALQFRAYPYLDDNAHFEQTTEDQDIAQAIALSRQQQEMAAKQAEYGQMLADLETAKRAQEKRKAEQEEQRRALFMQDCEVATRMQEEEKRNMQQSNEMTIPCERCEKNVRFNEYQAHLLQHQQEDKQTMQLAQYYEQKDEQDAQQLLEDSTFALKIQEELNKGYAWFCNGCFQMNMDVTKYQCTECGAMRPKPNIPKYVMQMKDDLASNIMNAIRSVEGHCVNIQFVSNFIVKYFQMCEEIGVEQARPKIVYHWTRAANFDAISKTGLKVPDGQKVQHATDTGYYGKGIYTSPDPNYAKGYGHGATQVFVCLSLPGRQYVASYPQMLGKPLMEGYDSHISNDRNGMEWVFFSSAQLLLCYLVTLDFLENQAKKQMEHVAKLLETSYLRMREERVRKLTKNDV